MTFFQCWKNATTERIALNVLMNTTYTTDSQFIRLVKFTVYAILSENKQRVSAKETMEISFFLGCHKKIWRTKKSFLS